MKIFKAPILAAMVGVSALGLSVAIPSITQAQTGQSPVPIDVWALRNVVNAVQVSPDGKHILVHINPTKDGEYLLQIYKTEDLSKPFRTLNADPMEITSAQWVSDNIILGQAWQVKRKTVKGPEDDVREYALLTYNLEKNKFNQIRGSFSFEEGLPKKPNSILISTGRAVGEDVSGVDPFRAFRPRSYYELDLEKGTQKLIAKGSEDYRTMSFDNDGNPRVRTAFNPTTNQISLEFRIPGESSWIKHPHVSFDQDEFEDLYKTLGGPWGPVGFSETDPEIVYMLDYRDGADKAQLWKFNARTGEYVEKLFESKDSDVMGIMTHSIPGENKLVAAVYPGAKYERHWFDEEEKALYEALEQQIPYAHQVSISSRSRDGGTMIVQNTGPQDPGSFWLVKDGKMAKLGSRNPALNQADLAEVKYIRYKARDGLEIPGYITIPKGEGPFPLVVQHNGGPHVNAVQGYSEMSQMLASAGYMVFYPQNRISTGWGKKHFDAGYGEHGLAMQDDKDDGVKYLIEQGLVDPDRVAFFGWSYGGYAALVATSREEQLYQCAVAVAAVADPAKSYRQRSGSGSSPKALDEWAKRRGMIGINPIERVDKINIPFLMVHGDVDRRVLYWHYTDYKKAVEAAGKSNMGQFLTLEGADHFGNTLMFEHQQQFYTKFLDYLKNDCGPGGL